MAEIPLLARDGSRVATALVDDADHEWLTALGPWRLSSHGYATTAGLSMHRTILELVGDERGLVGDHINRDRLDNRRTNLRAVTQAENMMNRPNARESEPQGIAGDWLGPGEIRRAFGISRRALKLWREADFPEPHVQLSIGPVWTAASVREWARSKPHLAALA